MEQETLFEGVTPAAARKLPDKERHALFVSAIVRGENQTQAYVAAGYSKKCAAQGASRLRDDPAIERAIRHERARLRMITPDLTPERLLQELGCIAYGDVGQLVNETGEFVPVHEMDEPTRRALASIEVDRKKNTVKYRLGDKRAAVELIAKIKGYMAPEEHRVKHSLEDLVTGGGESEDEQAA